MTFMEHIAAILRRLDSIGFDYGHTRISLYGGVFFVIVIIGVFVVARLTSLGVRHLFRRLTRLDPTEQLLGEKLVGILVWLLCILIGVDILGIDLTALTVFSGAFGLAIGFGLQKTFGNLLAGIILLMDRSIKPGDVIAVNGQGGSPSTVGQVNRIGIRAVSVITRDRVEFLIPNENLMVNQVENWSYSSRDVRIKVPVSVAYGTDIELAERLLLEAAHGSGRVLADPAPSIWLDSFGENGIHFEIQLWIDDPEDGIGNVRSDVLKRVWQLFKENGVSIPYPQREVHVKEWPAREGPEPPAKS
jgi:small-conductance mechanosensitive channel